MANYPNMTSEPPRIYTADDFANWDEALRQLAVWDHVLQKCERCKMPVEALRQECDAACDFFNGLSAEWRGAQADYPPPTGGT